MSARPALGAPPRALLARLAAGLALGAALAACGGVGAPSASGTKVDVSAVEYKFLPAQIAVPAGRVTFSVTNDGQAEHEFEVLQGDTVVGEVEGLVPGLTRSLTVDLAPGSYTFVCRLAAHDTLGMKGTLTVN